ncbi:MAG: helix-turn-helix domain-containing protein [Pseudolactococcus laudensis]|uniref:helix-turn-helix domain-containing protein n=1 Tax=Pseudolactococcus laudensis TaxID=1494461 RepID=UPI003F945D56
MTTIENMVFRQLNEQELAFISGGTLGDNIKQARLEHQMTQTMLAQALFVSKQAVSQWEKCVRESNIETVVRLREILHVPFDKLLK